MKLDFSAPILGLDGKPDPSGATLGSVSITALMATFPDEQNLSGEDKIKRYKAALIIQLGGEQEITVDDASLIKKLVAKAYGPLVVGRVDEIIK